MNRSTAAAFVAVLMLFALVSPSIAGVARQSNPPVTPEQKAAGVAPQPSAPSGAGCVAIADDSYTGAIGSMACFSVPGVATTITDLDLQMGVNHTWAGDLVFKIQNPAATTTVTLMSRPGFAEPADDGTGCCGFNADMVATSSITFDDDGGGASAENLGTALSVVCQDDGICNYVPNAGAATPGTLAAFDGQNGAGSWQVCVGDSAGGDVGDICSAALIFNGVSADLAITKDAPDGVADEGPFVYTLQVTNNGPADATNVVVSDTLPAGLSYISNDCGAGVAGPTVTWNVGTVTNGSSATCNLTVQMTTPGCIPVANTATVTSDVSDPNGANNTATESNQSDAVADGSFEDGTPSTFWTEASTNFGTPICDVAGCGVGGGTGPRTGDFWTWFGGTASNEEGSMTQSVTIPAAASASLTFWLEVPVCDPGSAADDFMEVTVDGTQVFLVDATSPLCGTIGYGQQTVDVSAWADGGAHTLEFHSITTGQIVNFFVDDVALGATACVEGGPGPGPAAEVPTLGTIGFVGLAGLLALAGFVALRRRTA